MEPIEYTLTIDAFSPDTLPMARLAEYLAALADLIGSKEHVHFIRVEKGSARLVHKVDYQEHPKVERRLAEVRADGGPKEASRGFSRLDELLANDNATGQLSGPRGVVIPFLGRDRPKQLSFPSFWQDGHIDGELVSIGGRDRTAHVILQDSGVTFSNCSLGRELARALAKHLYAGKIRLFGRGKWERSIEGGWKLLEFRVDRFDVLDDQSLGSLLNDLAKLTKDDLALDAYEEVLSERGIEEREF